MKTITTTVAGVALMAGVAAMIGIAAPAHADDTAINLPVTDTVRAELVTAGAVLTGRPASDFSGLRPGDTYYAYEPTNGMHWAAAALYGPKSYEAGIQLQDQNSYMIFEQSGMAGSTWIPIAAGFGPIPGGEAVCPLPQSVREVWHWKKDECVHP